ncbi:hypothetical protein BB560_001440 [Smittium megazygosporum]|uniref:Uncharacterized protein n=1 Tax=Smittium megazygosporum TaxID=133381 RepID=A0A2T9ZHK2_9FUNG|nr:hypothetical protein BB560_001440 [Smittium megazygosporum]
MSLKNNSDPEKLRQLLFSSSAETISNNLSQWLLEFHSTSKISTDFSFLIHSTSILSLRLETWISSYLYGNMSSFEQSSIYNIFNPEGWFLKLLLKYRIPVDKRMSLLKQELLIQLDDSSFKTSSISPPIDPKELEQKYPVWKLPITSLPASAQLQLILSTNNLPKNRSLTSLYSRCVYDKLFNQEFILLDMFEYILFSVIKSVGSNVPQNPSFDSLTTFKSIAKSAQSPNFLTQLAEAYLNYFAPTTVFLDVSLNPNPPNTAKSDPQKPVYNFKANKIMEDNILSFGNRLQNLSVIDFTCEIISLFWLPHFSKTALLSPYTTNNNDLSNIRDWSWTVSPNQVFGIQCFCLLIARFAIAEAWLEFKNISNYDNLQIDEKSKYLINTHEDAYKIARKKCINEALIESITFIFGSRLSQHVAQGTTMGTSPSQQLELLVLDYLVEAWIGFSFPWSCKIFNDFIKYCTPFISENNQARSKSSLPRNWEYRANRTLEIPVPELYSPTISLFLEAVVPSYDILASVPCPTHYNQTLDQVLNESSGSILCSDFINSSISLKKVNSQYIFKTSSRNFAVPLAIPTAPVSTNVSISSPVARATKTADAFAGVIGPTVDPIKSCRCKTNPDILTILSKVISAIGNAELASQRISYNQSQSERNSLWLRTFSDSELAPNFSLVRDTDKRNVLISKTFGQFSLLDYKFYDSLESVYNLMLPSLFLLSFPHFKAATSFFGSKESVAIPTSIPSKLFYYALNYRFPNYSGSVLFLSSREHISPFLLRLVEIDHLSSNFSKSLKNDVKPKRFINNTRKTPENRSVIPESPTNQNSSSNESLISQASGFLFDLISDQIIAPLFSSNSRNSSSQLELIASNKKKAERYFYIHQYITNIIHSVIFTFGVSPFDLNAIVNLRENNDIEKDDSLPRKNITSMLEESVNIIKKVRQDSIPNNERKLSSKYQLQLPSSPKKEKIKSDTGYSDNTSLASPEEFKKQIEQVKRNRKLDSREHSRFLFEPSEHKFNTVRPRVTRTNNNINNLKNIS